MPASGDENAAIDLDDIVERADLAAATGALVKFDVLASKHLDCDGYAVLLLHRFTSPVLELSNPVAQARQSTVSMVATRYPVCCASDRQS